MSIPSVVFAEASWYGSIRAGVTSSGGNASVSNHLSRWGFKGSSEVSEGLTAVYRFETRINVTNANQQEPNGRLSYVGLTGGFGSITAGQIWSATYNSVGAITDLSTSYGSSETSGRHGNVISYAISNDTMSMQVDAMLDGSKTGNNIDEFEFGVSMNIADIGKIAFAHKRVEDDTTPKMTNSYTSTNEVLSSAVLDSKNTVTGGTVTNTLKVGEIKVEGDVPLPVSGNLKGIPGNLAKAPEVLGVLCIDNTTGKPMEREATATGGCTDKETEVPTVKPIKVTQTNKPLTIATLPDPTIKTQTVTTAASDIKHTIKTGDDAGDYDVKISKRWRNGTKIDTVGACILTTAGEECKEEAYYYYETTDKDGKTKENEITSAEVAAGFAVTSNVNLDHDLKATGGDLNGEVKVSDVTVETKTEVVTDQVIKTTTTKDTLQTATPNTVPGSTSNFVAGQVTIGGIIGYLGYKEVKTNGIDATASTTFAGIRGSLGDTGISYFTQLRNQETASPWMFGLSKSLGGGASVNFEYADDDLPTAKSQASAWLRVDF